MSLGRMLVFEQVGEALTLQNVAALRFAGNPDAPRRDKHTPFNKKRYKISSTQIIKHIKIHNKTVSKTPENYIWKNVTFEESPRYFSIFSDFRPLSKE